MGLELDTWGQGLIRDLWFNFRTSAKNVWAYSLVSPPKLDFWALARSLGLGLDKQI